MTRATSRRGADLFRNDSEIDGPPTSAMVSPPEQRTTPRRHVAILAMLALVAFAACGGGDSEQKREAECTELRERVVDLQLELAAGGRDDDRTRAELAKHRRQRLAEGQDDYLAACSQWSEERRRCALRAGSLAEYQSCQSQGEIR